MCPSSASRHLHAAARLLAVVLIAAVTAGVARAAEFRGTSYTAPPGWTSGEQDGNLLLAPLGGSEADLVIAVLSPPRPLGGTPFRAWLEQRMAADLNAQARVVSQGEVRAFSAGGLEMLTTARAVQDAAGDLRLQMFNAVSDGRQAALAMAVAANDQAADRHADGLRSLFESMRVGAPAPAAESSPHVAGAASAPGRPLEAPPGEPAAAQGELPAGEYHCITTRWSPNTPIVLEPSILGRIILDGRGGYRVSGTGNSGGYREGTGGFAFVSGPLADWPALVETVDARPRIRLGKTRETPPNPRGASFGEHRCTWRK